MKAQMFAVKNFISEEVVPIPEEANRISFGLPWSTIQPLEIIEPLEDQMVILSAELEKLSSQWQILDAKRHYELIMNFKSHLLNQNY